MGLAGASPYRWARTECGMKTERRGRRWGSAGASPYRSYGRSLCEAPAEPSLFRVPSVFNPWLRGCHAAQYGAWSRFGFGFYKKGAPGGAGGGQGEGWAHCKELAETQS
jgi:hypothetical protein